MHSFHNARNVSLRAPNCDCGTFPCKVSRTFPRLAADTLTVCGEEKLCGVFLGQPADLVDLLLDLQTLQVVELGLVALERAVNVVIAAALRLVLEHTRDTELGFIRCSTKKKIFKSFDPSRFIFRAGPSSIL